MSPSETGVILALEAELALLPAGCPRAEFQQVLPAHHRGTDEAVLDVTVDGAAVRRTAVPRADGPGTGAIGGSASRGLLAGPKGGLSSLLLKPPGSPGPRSREEHRPSRSPG